MSDAMPPPNPSAEMRGEKRLAVSSLTLPFLGSREEDHQSFQYLLLDTSPHGASIAIPKWALARERLNQNDVVNLHVPFRVHGETYDQGKVRWAKWRDDLDAQICGIRLEKATLPMYPIFITLDRGGAEVSFKDFSQSAGLLLCVLKDTYLLKKGVGVYLEHLIPYSSRVTEFNRHDFAQLRELFFEDIHQRVREHEKGLEALFNQVKSQQLPEAQAAFLDLENLRELVESELYLGIFQATFASELLTQLVKAIKSLEQRLYYNYNTAVMIYLRSLS